MGHLRRAGGALQEGSLYALLFFLPFSNAAVEIGFGVLLVGWVLERAQPEGWVRSLWSRPSLRGLSWSLAGFLIVGAASIIWSTHADKSVRALVSKWLEYFLFTVMAADVVCTRPRILARALLVLTVSSGLVVTEALLQEWLGTGPLRRLSLEYYGRMRGPYTNPADLGTYLMTSLFVVGAAAVVWRGRGRAVAAILLVVLAGCLIRTEALGAWVGLAAGAGVLAAGRRSLRRQALAMAFVLMVAGGVYLQRMGRLSSTFSWSDIGQTDRLVMWQAALGMIRDRPLTGHGLNTFMANYLDYWVGGERQPRYAHSCYLQIAAEVGLVGLAAFAGILWGLGWHIVAGLGRLSGPGRMWVLGLAGGLVAFGVQAAVDTNFYVVRQAVLFWVLAGMALGASAAEA